MLKEQLVWGQLVKKIMETDNISAALSKASGQLKVNLQTAKAVEKDVFVTKPGFYLGGKRSYVHPCIT